MFASAAAVAGVLVGSVATWAATRPAEPAAATVVASAALDPLPDWRANGSARLLDEPDGQRLLVVDLRAPAAGSADFHEVWLLSSDAKRLVSLGVLTGSQGSFVLSAGLDVAAYPVVDVSREPQDGNPRHSGDSIVRGRLDV